MEEVAAEGLGSFLHKGLKALVNLTAISFSLDMPAGFRECSFVIIQANETSHASVKLDRVKTGKLVFGDELRVPHEGGYEITSRSKRANDFVPDLYSSHILGRPLAAHEIVPEAWAREDLRGLAFAARVAPAGRERFDHAPVLMKAKYFPEGGAAHGGRLFEVAEFWIGRLQDWYEHPGAIIRRALADIAIEPDRLETAREQRLNLPPVLAQLGGDGDGPSEEGVGLLTASLACAMFADGRQDLVAGKDVFAGGEDYLAALACAFERLAALARDAGYAGEFRFLMDRVSIEIGCPKSKSEGGQVVLQFDPQSPTDRRDMPLELTRTATEAIETVSVREETPEPAAADAPAAEQVSIAPEETRAVEGAGGLTEERASCEALPPPAGEPPPDAEWPGRQPAGPAGEPPASAEQSQPVASTLLFPGSSFGVHRPILDSVSRTVQPETTPSLFSQPAIARDIPGALARLYAEECLNAFQSRRLADSLGALNYAAKFFEEAGGDPRIIRRHADSLAGPIRGALCGLAASRLADVSGFDATFLDFWYAIGLILPAHNGGWCPDLLSDALMGFRARIARNAVMQPQELSKFEDIRFLPVEDGSGLEAALAKFKLHKLYQGVIAAPPQGESLAPVIEISKDLARWRRAAFLREDFDATFKVDLAPSRARRELVAKALLIRFDWLNWDTLDTAENLDFAGDLLNLIEISRNGRNRLGLWMLPEAEGEAPAMDEALAGRLVSALEKYIGAKESDCARPSAA